MHCFYDSISTTSILMCMSDKVSYLLSCLKFILVNKKILSIRKHHSDVVNHEIPCIPLRCHLVHRGTKQGLEPS